MTWSGRKTLPTVRFFFPEDFTFISLFLPFLPSFRSESDFPDIQRSENTGHNSSRYFSRIMESRNFGVATREFFKNVVSNWAIVLSTFKISGKKECQSLVSMSCLLCLIILSFFPFFFFFRSRLALVQFGSGNGDAPVRILQSTVFYATILCTTR